jgi:PAS domain S-box-containing protein
MLGHWRFNSRDSQSVLDALHRSLAVIEFDRNGRVLSANANFCALLDYRLSDLKGKHHSLFVDPEYARSGEYAAFWTQLGRGEIDVRDYKWVGRNGKTVWIRASYSPVTTSQGRVAKVVAVTTDISSTMIRNAELEGKINALSRVQAIVEFTTSGEIITANSNFLNLMGYSLDEIKGKPHGLFVAPTYALSREYADFWSKLKCGVSIADEFQYVGKDGKPVWLQASYNPILDVDSKILKIVTFAADVTTRVLAVETIEKALSKLAGTVGGIFVSATKITALISELTQSAKTQAADMNRPNSATHQIDQVPLQNVAKLEKATAASRLKSEVAALSSLLGGLDPGDQNSEPPTIPDPATRSTEGTVVHLKTRLTAVPRDAFDQRHGEGGSPAKLASLAPENLS